MLFMLSSFVSVMVGVGGAKEGRLEEQQLGLMAANLNMFIKGHDVMSCLCPVHSDVG